MEGLGYSTSIGSSTVAIDVFRGSSLPIVAAIVVDFPELIRPANRVRPLPLVSGSIMLQSRFRSSRSEGILRGRRRIAIPKPVTELARQQRYRWPFSSVV